MKVDPITGRKLICATLKPCEKKPQNIIAIDCDNHEQYVVVRKPVFRANTTLIEQNKFNLH